MSLKIKLYLWVVGKLMCRHLFFVASVLPGQYIKQYNRVVYIILVFITGIFFFLSGMSNVLAIPKAQETERVDNSEEKKIEGSGKNFKGGNSEIIPSSEEDSKENLKVSKLLPSSEKPAAATTSVFTGEVSPGERAAYHFNLGVYYQKQGNNIRAIEEYEKALKLDPNNAEVHNNLGVIYKEQDDLNKAVEHYQLVVSINPRVEEAHNNLGVIHYLKGNHRDAELEYRKVLELNPHNLISRMNIGLVYKAQGLRRKAIDTLEDVLAEDPFRPEAHYNLAIIYEDLGHLERAIWHFGRFVDNAGKGHPALTGKVIEHIKNLEVISGEVLR